MIKVTIITVVYNNELISTAIQSVIDQDYPNIEYIVVDGGSTDNTLKIVKSYGEKIHKLISERDNGIYDAINKGIKVAEGDIIGILNSDDFLADNNVISRIVSTFNQNSGIDATYSDIVFIDKTDINKITRYYSSEKFRPWMFKFGFQLAHPTFYAKKELFLNYGVYKTDYKIAGDFELLLRFLIIHKIKTKYSKDVWVKMRPGGVSTSGIKSILKMNSEVIRACRSNHIYTNYLMVYSKYFIKWWSFIFKNKTKQI